MSSLIPSNGAPLCNTQHDAPPLPYEIMNIENAGRKREMQAYVMGLDGVDLEDEAEDSLFTKYSIDTVYSSYLTSRYRVRQYTHFLTILKREEHAWALKVKKASRLMPDYNPTMTMDWPGAVMVQR
ncbi:hypothetical protein EDD22DRAFT_960219 [Suillus occidentalis]|nr:hypothetical protein EDD22DRAFT_960219 [Suillus occidentalis]